MPSSTRPFSAICTLALSVGCAQSFQPSPRSSLLSPSAFVQPSVPPRRITGTTSLRSSQSFDPEESPSWVDLPSSEKNAVVDRTLPSFELATGRIAMVAIPLLVSFEVVNGKSLPEQLLSSLGIA